MGNCLCRAANERVQSSTNIPNRKKVVMKSQQLRHDKFKWKSDIPLTTEHISSKREEFWHTAPAFDGRQEIWDALKAAVEAVEKNDYILAQAIIDGANIILPSGALRDCYDELGNRYQLPLYVLSYPTNLSQSGGDTHGTTTGSMTVSSQQGDIESAQSHRGNTHKWPQCLGGDRYSPPTHPKSGTVSTNEHRDNQSTSTNQVQLTLRLSSNSSASADGSPSDGGGSTLNHHIVVPDPTRTTVADAKVLLYNQLVEQTNHEVLPPPAHQQRWFCYGQLLPDHSLFSQLNIPYTEFVIQVITPR